MRRPFSLPAARLVRLTMNDDAIPAATLILVRDRAGAAPELLMVERAAGMAFAAGAWVFPGGRIDKADEIIAFTQTCVVADMTTPIALSAADLCRRLKLATADAIVYATALAHGAEIITCDRHFEKLPHIIYFAKTGS